MPEILFCRIPLLLLLSTVAWKYASANLSLHILLDLFLINAIISSSFCTQISPFILPSWACCRKLSKQLSGARIFPNITTILQGIFHIETSIASKTHWNFLLCQFFDRLCVCFASQKYIQTGTQISFVIFEHWGL